MNKKIIYISVPVVAVIIITILLVSFVGFHKVGDTIKYENLSITLTRAEIAKKLARGGQNNPFLPSTSGVSSFGYRTAEKGHTFISFSVKVKNSGSKINLEDIFNDRAIVVKYKGEKYYSSASNNLSEKRCAKNCFDSGYVAWKNEKGVWQWKAFNYMNFTLDKGKSIDELRIYLDIPVETKTIKDKFQLIFELPSGKDNSEKFKFKIN